MRTAVALRTSLARAVLALAMVVPLALALGPPALAAETPVPDGAASPAAAASDFTRAQQLFRSGSYKEAIALLDPYLATHPRDARAYVLRGDCKADLDDNQGALRDYNSAIKIAPEYQYAYVTRCETRLQLNDPAGALSDCDVAIRLDPSDALAYQDRGDVYFDRESYERALADYDKAVELGRSSAYVFAARCDADRLNGKRDRAAADCEKALTIDPKSRRGLWARGRLALTGGRYTDAIADLNAYITQNPKGSDTAYYFRGYAYNRIQSFRLALEDLQTYVERAPNDADGYKERAIARNGVGDKDGALADFDVAIRDYKKAGDTTAADRVTLLVKAVRAGKPLAL
jgi:tetratricopeptide (TPR) repeat protein